MNKGMKIMFLPNYLDKFMNKKAKNSQHNRRPLNTFSSVIAFASLLGFIELQAALAAHRRPFVSIFTISTQTICI